MTANPVRSLNAARLPGARFATPQGNRPFFGWYLQQRRRGRIVAVDPSGRLTEAGVERQTEDGQTRIIE